MKVRRKTVAALAVTITAVVAATGLVGAGSAAPTQEPFLAALISDVGRFNDKSFNQNQLKGLNRAKSVLGIEILPLQSNSDADYIPNLTNALIRGADAIICAGFLMADACAQVANTDEGKQIEFAITDYPVQVAPFNRNPNVTGLTYAANQAGCLVGHMAALMVKQQGGPQVIGAVGGIKIPPVDVWIAGYQFCAKRANAKVRVLVGYSQDFVASDKCKAVAENLISRRAKILFQVAGQCGLGTLKAADEAKIWGIGVDVDQYALAKRVLTSGIKRVDNGVYNFVKAVYTTQPIGGGNLFFDLENNGVGFGKVNPAVPKPIVASTLKLRRLMIDGKVRPPTTLPS